jgi:hypothetical protein
MVNKEIIDNIPAIIAELRVSDFSEKNAFLGFDACIDSIVKIVRNKDDNNTSSYFANTDEFGEFLINLGRKSCGLELDTRLSKIGGNMVITANALGNLGVGVECIGTFGYPEILPVFNTMSQNCKLHTVADTINATALEFDSSKVIMFDPGPYNKLGWNVIRDILGMGSIIEMISGKKLVAFLNWSEIEHSSEIWEGMLNEVLPNIEKQPDKPFFFSDFSDCSRKSKAEIRHAIDLLRRFRSFFNVNLSLNQNEAALIANALNINDNQSDEEFVRELYSSCNADVLIIHRVNDALAYDGKEYEKCDTFLCTEPRILTGGGDNFNAGYCLSLFHNFGLFQSLLVANAVSGSYVKNGYSPDLKSLIDFLRQV